VTKTKQRIEKLRGGLELRYPKSNPEGHPSYYLDNKRLPSVTTIIGGNLGWNKRVLMAWQARLFREGKDPDKVREEACDIGTLIHTAIEHHIYGQDEIDIEDVNMRDLAKMAKGLEQYTVWERLHDVQYLESEFAMGSKELGVAGTADAIAYVDGKLTLIDFKTSNRLNNEMIVQLAAYKEMVEETSDYEIEQCIIVHISKGDDVIDADRVKSHVIDNNMIVEGLKIFKNLCYLHEIDKKMKKYIKKLDKC